jgi:peptidoglycan hydrolase-like protein with peptidoglycan-binding domain
MNLTTLYAAIGQSDFKKSLSPAQRNTIELIVNQWKVFGYPSDNALAYVLATAQWETANKMVPVRETLASTDKSAMAILERDFKAGKLKWVKTPYWRTGYFGRGMVQLTHEDNYSGPIRDAVMETFGKAFDIHKDPSLLITNPDISCFVLIEGMTKGVTLKADFTPWALETFINDKKVDYLGARKTVNPGDKSSVTKIKDLALLWEEAIREARRDDDEQFLGPAGPDVKGQGLYDGRVHSEVRDVQELLAKKLYPVGQIDGKWGDRTAAAVLAFRRKNGLPLTDEDITDKDFLAALAVGDEMELPTSRTEATAADLRAQGSKTIAIADKLKWVGSLAIGGGGLQAVNSGLDTVDQVNTTLSRVHDVTATVVKFLQDNFLFLAAGIGAVVVWQAIRITKAKVQAHREGKDV